MSSGYNQCVVLGRLRDQPEELQTKNGKLFIKALIEVFIHRKTADGTAENEKRLVVATLFAGTAAMFQKHVSIGDMVHLSGRLDAMEWEGRGGKKCYSLSFIVEHVSLLPNGGKEP